MPFDGTSFLKESEVELSPVTKLLLEGKSKIERGWCKHNAISRIGALSQYCMLGALYYSTDDAMLYIEAEQVLNKALPYSFHSISLYNDKPDRTISEVLAVYDKAIALSMKE